MSASSNARANFNLIERLRGRVLNSDKITIFTDEVTGRKLGGSEPRMKVVAGFEIPDEPRRWGVLGEIHALEQDNEDGKNQERIDALKEKAAELEKTLADSSLIFTIQALPDEAATPGEDSIETVAAAARAHLGLAEGDDVPDERSAEYNSRFAGELLSRVIVSIQDAEGNFGSPLSPDEAVMLAKGGLPRSEYQRLSRLVRELQYDTHIAEDAVADVDF